MKRLILLAIFLTFALSVNAGDLVMPTLPSDYRFESKKAKEDVQEKTGGEDGVISSDPFPVSEEEEIASLDSDSTSGDDVEEEVSSGSDTFVIQGVSDYWGTGWKKPKKKKEKSDGVTLDKFFVEGKEADEEVAPVPYNPNPKKSEDESEKRSNWIASASIDGLMYHDNSDFEEVYPGGIRTVRLGFGFFSPNDPWGIGGGYRFGGADGELESSGGSKASLRIDLDGFDISAIYRGVLKGEQYYYFRGSYFFGNIEESLAIDNFSVSSEFSISGPELVFGSIKGGLGWEVFCNEFSGEEFGSSDGGLRTIGIRIVLGN